ncbi:predicted GPI-anchored protein 58 [Miscanthus floridulus]|uniref:predicted GPI-anchored protein 58 n=1 Tax=Miscanthus floridulus TaxID=154761 RepID=UPI003458678C
MYTAGPPRSPIGHTHPAPVSVTRRRRRPAAPPPPATPATVGDPRAPIPAPCPRPAPPAPPPAPAPSPAARCCRPAPRRWPPTPPLRPARPTRVPASPPLRAPPAPPPAPLNASGPLPPEKEREGHLHLPSPWGPRPARPPSPSVLGGEEAEVK